MGALVSLLARRLHIYRPSLEYDLSKSPTVMGTDCPPIYEAALVGDWEAVRRHLTDEPQTAAHVDNSGNTALHICCRQSHPPIDVIESLIQVHPKALVRRTVDGLSPLHFAAYFAADGHVIDVMMTELSVSFATNDNSLNSSRLRTSSVMSDANDFLISSARTPSRLIL